MGSKGRESHIQTLKRKRQKVRESWGEDKSEGDSVRDTQNEWLAEGVRERRGVKDIMRVWGQLQREGAEQSGGVLWKGRGVTERPWGFYTEGPRVR